MTPVRKMLNELRNQLSEPIVEDIAPGVKLAVHRSNAADLAESNSGGALNIEFSLALNPDGKHQYIEPVYMHANVYNDLLSTLHKRQLTEPLQAQLRVRNTWPTPTFEVDRFCEVDPAMTVRDFVARLVWTATLFVQNHYRELVRTLHAAGYFDATDWSCGVATAFINHMQVA